MKSFKPFTAARGELKENEYVPEVVLLEQKNSGSPISESDLSKRIDFNKALFNDARIYWNASGCGKMLFCPASSPIAA